MGNKAIIIGTVVGLFVLAAAVFVWMTLPSTPKQAEGPAPAVQQMATSTYATSTFSIVYPKDFSVNEAYVYDQVNPKKPIYGVKFTIPASMATGTNLSGFDTGISVEQLPRAKNCTGDIYLAADVRPSKVVDNGVEYSVATSSGAAAGNLYQEVVFALVGSSPCTALRYYIHSTSIGNYDPGVVQPFDEAAVFGALDKIRQSLKLGAPPAAPAPAPAAQ